MSIKRDELYKELKGICGDDYSIGFHAINYFDFKTNSIEERDKMVSDIKNDVLSHGLEIQDGRPLKGTVAFTGFNYWNEQDFINYHRYGDIKEYIIIALPKVLKSGDGEEIFLGHPVSHLDNPLKRQFLREDELKEFHVDRKMGTQGREITCLAEAFIPDYSEETNIGILDPMFVLGTFKILDQKDTMQDDEIELKINPNHICFRNHIIPTAFFDRKKKDIGGYLAMYGINKLPNYNLSEEDVQTLISSETEPVEKKKGICHIPETLFGIGPAIINTLEQLQRVIVKSKSDKK